VAWHADAMIKKPGIDVNIQNSIKNK